MANIMRLGGSVGSKTTIGASYNADGTQNLIIKDDGSVIEIPDPNPVLLWTNGSPNSAFANQTVNVGSGYSGFIIKAKYGTTTTSENYMTYNYFPASNVLKYLSCHGGQTSALYRAVTANASGAIVFASGNTNTSYVIPLYIWGVKFTL